MTDDRVRGRAPTPTRPASVPSADHRSPRHVAHGRHTTSGTWTPPSGERRQRSLVPRCRRLQPAGDPASDGHDQHGPAPTQHRHVAVTDVGYAAALVLAALFAWAGVAKVADRRRTTSTFAALGLPRPGVLGTAVPCAEVALAVGLLAVPAVAAYAALALLAGFTTFLVRAVRGGVRVPCGCFGSAGDQPISEVDVVRNVLLALGAVVATFAGEAHVPSLGAVLVTAAMAAAGATLVTLLASRRTATGVSGR